MLACNRRTAQLGGQAAHHGHVARERRDEVLRVKDVGEGTGVVPKGGLVEVRDDERCIGESCYGDHVTDLGLGHTTDPPRWTTLKAL